MPNANSKLKNMNAAEGIPTKYQSPVDPAESEVTQWLNPRKRNDPRRMSGVISCPGIRRGLGHRLRFREQKRGRKNPTQHRYHTTLFLSSQRGNGFPKAKSVPCTKTNVFIWGTFRLEKFENPWYLIGTKRRYKNSKSSGGLPKAKVN